MTMVYSPFRVHSIGKWIGFNRFQSVSFNNGRVFCKIKTDDLLVLLCWFHCISMSPYLNFISRKILKWNICKWENSTLETRFCWRNKNSVGIDKFSRKKPTWHPKISCKMTQSQPSRFEEKMSRTLSGQNVMISVNLIIHSMWWRVKSPFFRVSPSLSLSKLRLLKLKDSIRNENREKAMKAKNETREFGNSKQSQRHSRNSQRNEQKCIPLDFYTQFIECATTVHLTSQRSENERRKKKKTPSTKNKIMATHCLHIWNNSIIAWICVYGLGDARAMLLLLLVRWRDRVVSVAGVPRSVKNSINYHWWDIDESDSFPWRDDNDNDNSK